MDECPGDSSVSASPRGSPRHPHRRRLQLCSSNSLLPRPPFTLCCLFVRRATGCRKRGVPERPELETHSASALDIFRGKRAASQLFTASALAPVKEFTFPGSCHPLQLVSIERGAGQYITSEEFPSAAPRQRGLRRQSSAPDRLRAGGAVAETRTVCSWGAGAGEGLRRVCVFLRACLRRTEPLHGTAGPKPVEATGAVAAAWAALLVDSLRSLGVLPLWSASALCAENVPRRLAVTPIVLPSLGKREVAVFQMCRPSLAAGLLGFFSGLIH